jgi:hypothetical protein
MSNDSTLVVETTESDGSGNGNINNNNGFKPVIPSLFGDGHQSTLSELILENKGVLISIVTGKFLNILITYDQPFEMFFAVILIVTIWFLISKQIRMIAIMISRNAGSEDIWKKTLVSYIDLISVVIITFFTHYASSVAEKEWEKVGFSRTDTIVVGTFLIIMFIGILVFIMSKPNVSQK